MFSSLRHHDHGNYYYCCCCLIFFYSPVIISLPSLPPTVPYSISPPPSPRGCPHSPHTPTPCQASPFPGASNLSCVLMSVHFFSMLVTTQKLNLVTTYVQLLQLCYFSIAVHDCAVELLAVHDVQGVHGLPSICKASISMPTDILSGRELSRNPPFWV